MLNFVAGNSFLKARHSIQSKQKIQSTMLAKMHSFSFTWCVFTTKQIVRSTS